MPHQHQLIVATVNFFLLTVAAISTIIFVIGFGTASSIDPILGATLLVLTGGIYVSKQLNHSPLGRWIPLAACGLSIFFIGVSLQYEMRVGSALFVHATFSFLFFLPSEKIYRASSLGLSFLLYVLFLAQPFAITQLEWTFPTYFSFLVPIVSFLVLIICVWILQRKQEEYASRLEEKSSLLQEAQTIAKIGHWTYQFAEDRWQWSDELHHMFQFPLSLPVTTDEYYGRIHPADRLRVKQAMETAIRKKEYLRIKHRFYTAIQEERHLLSICRPVENKQGEVYMIRGIMQDITDQELSEQALIQARDEAQAATKAKTDFLNTMTHEIRTPLSAVIGMVDLLKETSLLGDQKNYVNTIKLGGEHLLSVINNILDHAKIESGKIELEHLSFPLLEPIEDTLDLMQPQARSKGLALTTDVAEGLPEVIKGDLGKIRQILVNLVANALKFTEQGSINLRVRQQAIEGTQRNVCFSVVDTGIGIQPDRLARIFDSFTQEDASINRKYGGTGLGLSISKHLVDLMGGRMWAESESGKGTTFHFSIWVEAIPASQTGTPQKHLSVPAPKQFVPSPHLTNILVVEDHSINQLVITNLLKNLNYSADLANDGLEAIQAVKEKAYDLILMDVQMPKMGGLEATQQIRRYLQEHGLPQPAIIALTASALIQERERCMAVGMDDFLTKPVKLETLSRTLSNIPDPSPA
ncbi:MAG: ATP-binding protein [Bacteroidota bacterium]